ncbi:hypothetical protein QFZ49_007396 [Streptomyces turgidiscabies]|uniref:Uncharacterized protein n=1 Tax=Streptomyces turgidiscabies TaxID=85558 RepID=A0ABU0RZJ9_9ACTN|nr:hypothetical protein [Streptomyces turgidiscabies]
MADFGERLAPMESVLPVRRPTGQDDRETLRWAVRSDGDTGFLFVNNHQPHEPLPDQPDTSFTVAFPGAPELTLPSASVTVPQGAYFCWPLRLDVAGLRLDWATAQPVCTVDVGSRTVLVLAATDGVPVELALDIGTLRYVHTPMGKVASTDGRFLVTGLRPGVDALVEVGTVDGGQVGLLVLDAATARTAYRGVAWGAERLILCGDGGAGGEGVVFDEAAGEVRVHSPAAEISLAVLPAPERPPGENLEVAADGVFTRYTLPTGGASGTLDVSLVRPAGPAPELVTGVLGRASAPADQCFDTSAAEYLIDVPDELPRTGTLLRVHWTGDVARAYAGDTLVADQFFSGRVWEIGLDRLPDDALRAGGGLRVRVLPFAADAPVHLPVPVPVGEAGIARVEWVTVRTHVLTG